MSESKSEAIRYEVVERYCPKRRENVVMRRTFGKTPSLQCMNCDSCQQSKDCLCNENGVK